MTEPKGPSRSPEEHYDGCLCTRCREEWPEACQGMHDMTGWREVTCEVRDDFMRDHADRRSCFSGLTDPEGHYGPGVVFTEWGVKDGEKPWLRDYRWTATSCTHFMPRANIAWPSTKGSER